MKLSKSRFRAVLQERPWLARSIGHITGVHPYWVKQNGGIWDKHLEAWAIENIAEITVRPFGDLNLEEKAEFVRSHFGPPDEQVNYMNGNGYHWRRHEAFIHTEFHLFTHSTYLSTSSEPYAYCWTVSSTSDEGGPHTVAESIRGLRRPHYPGVGREVKVPHIFDAVVRITKVGVVRQCSSATIDVFSFPADFDPASV